MYDAYCEGRFLGTFSDEVAALEAILSELPDTMTEAEEEEFCYRLQYGEVICGETGASYIEECPFPQEKEFSDAWEADSYDALGLNPRNYHL